MGDKKPKKPSSGNSDAHKAKVAKDDAARQVAKPIPPTSKDKRK